MKKTAKKIVSAETRRIAVRVGDAFGPRACPTLVVAVVGPKVRVWNSDSQRYSTVDPLRLQRERGRLSENDANHEIREYAKHKPGDAVAYGLARAS